MNLLSHPVFRSILTVLFLLFIMQVLKTKWSWKGTGGRHGEGDAPGQPRLAVAHFMLGNTYPFTPADWTHTFDLAEDTGLNALVLNLGPEDWQLSQAQSAFDILSSRQQSPQSIQLFLSLDMNVLPSSTLSDTEELVNKVAGLLRREIYLRHRGRPLLSTFGGHSATFGGAGWPGFLSRLEQSLGKKVLFMPAFFMPPADFISLPYVDGCFAWNNAWPMGNHAVDLREDEPYLRSHKPYMAPVSPLFSTHYGTSGEWAFNKNWIYRSDDLLFPKRFSDLISLPADRSPSIIQIVSWNDYGESHSIAPVLGAEPGSQSWTKDMDHKAFREMTRYFIGIWRDGLREVQDESVRVWGWWRTHPKELIASDDMVGRPDHVDWAQDLLNFVIVLPDSKHGFELVVHNGPATHRRSLTPGRANMVTIPFVSGHVRFEVQVQSKDDTAATVLSGEGRKIDDEIERYNFNMWTGSWSTTEIVGQA